MLENIRPTQPMFCGHCGKKIIEGTVFCVYCGAKLNTVSTETNTDEKKPAIGTKNNDLHWAEASELTNIQEDVLRDNDVQSERPVSAIPIIPNKRASAEEYVTSAEIIGITEETTAEHCTEKSDTIEATPHDVSAEPLSVEYHDDSLQFNGSTDDQKENKDSESATPEKLQIPVSDAVKHKKSRIICFSVIGAIAVIALALIGTGVIPVANDYLSWLPDRIYTQALNESKEYYEYALAIKPSDPIDSSEFNIDCSTVDGDWIAVEHDESGKYLKETAYKADGSLYIYEKTAMIGADRYTIYDDGLFSSATYEDEITGDERMVLCYDNSVTVYETISDTDTLNRFISFSDNKWSAVYPQDDGSYYEYDLTSNGGHFTEYDDNNVLFRETDVVDGGSEITIKEYDSDGNNVRTLFFASDGSYTDQYFGTDNSVVKMNQTTYMPDSTWKIAYYDEDEEVTKISWYDYDGYCQEEIPTENPDESVKIVYDIDGTVSMANYVGDDYTSAFMCSPETQYLRHYDYDENGKTIAMTSFEDDTIASYTYENNLMSTMVLYAQDDNATYLYKYDTDDKMNTKEPVSYKYVEDGSIVIYNGISDDVEIDYLYDENGQLVFYTKTGTLLNKSIPVFKYVFDENGNVEHDISYVASTDFTASDN